MLDYEREAASAMPSTEPHATRSVIDLPIVGKVVNGWRVLEAQRWRVRCEQRPRTGRVRNVLICECTTCGARRTWPTYELRYAPSCMHVQRKPGGSRRPGVAGHQRADARRCRCEDIYDPEQRRSRYCLRCVEGLFVDGSTPYADDAWCRALVALHPGGMRLEDIAVVMGVTRERVRQIEASATRKIARTHGAEIDADRAAGGFRMRALPCAAGRQFPA